MFALSFQRRKLTNRTNLKIPTFRFLIASKVGWKLAFVFLETSFKFLENILWFLYFICCLLHLNNIKVWKYLIWNAWFTSIWNIEQGSRYFLAIDMRRLHVSYNKTSWFEVKIWGCNDAIAGYDGVRLWDVRLRFYDGVRCEVTVL